MGCSGGVDGQLGEDAAGPPARAQHRGPLAWPPAPGRRVRVFPAPPQARRSGGIQDPPGHGVPAGERSSVALVVSIMFYHDKQQQDVTSGQSGIFLSTSRYSTVPLGQYLSVRYCSTASSAPSSAPHARDAGCLLAPHDTESLRVRE